MVEKNYAPGLKEKKLTKNIPAKEKNLLEKKPLNEKVKKLDKPKELEKEVVEKDNVTTSAKSEEVKKTEEKKSKKQVVKKESVQVNVLGARLSTKVSMAICDFVRGKKISDAISELEQVLLKKKAVPMKGEIPHRKGKMMSGRYPVVASKEFIILLKSLQANAVQHEVENPVIVEAIANKGSRPYGRFGKVKRKRTHIKLVAAENKNNGRKKNN
jgi:ribosomal protein L22